MSYSSKTYSSGNTLYADDMNNLVSGIDDLYDRVAAIDGQGTPSSGENIEYTLSQGYVSKTDDNNVNTTRVKTNFIYGSFSVKVNDGYVIRAIYTYPTDSVSSSYTEILSNSLDCTSYDLKNEGAYAVLTFAKASDPTASLSPTEDIIMSLTTYVEQKPDTAAGCLYINRAVFFGDSITVGCNASGSDKGGNVSPYCETWTTMVTEYLNSKYNEKDFRIDVAMCDNGRICFVRKGWWRNLLCWQTKRSRRFF